MKSLTSVLKIGFLSALLINTAQAAQDHNSSRSNKTGSIAAPNETEILLELTKSDALAVAKTMIAVDQQDGFTGEYEITVNTHVSIKRVKDKKDKGTR